MRIQDLPTVERGSAGSNGSWTTHRRLTSSPGVGAVVQYVYHYGTLMLAWNVSDPSDPDYLDYSIGWGSVSDQGGMNTLFRALALPLYFARAGGNPEIVQLDSPQYRWGVTPRELLACRDRGSA